MGSTRFSRAELEAIKSLLQEVRCADRSREKVLRARLRRRFDFYISDFAAHHRGLAAPDVDALLREGVITVSDDAAPSSVAERPPGLPLKDARPGRPRTASARSTAPATPSAFTQAELKAAGFIGWRTWGQLRASQLAEVSAAPGAYVIYRPELRDSAFLDTSQGGHLKGRVPTVPIATLKENWISSTHVVYIGKADALRTRLRQYARFGAGEPGHWGGRYIWQLADCEKLLVAWHAISWDETARDYERRLLKRFAELHNGRRPFANLTG